MESVSYFFPVRSHMPGETLATIETLLESVLEESDRSEVRYKLRTALQLLEVHRADFRELEAAADSDVDLEQRLRELGYIQ